MKFDNISDEDKLQTSTMVLASESERVGKQIDDLTSASLKRVLRTVCHVHLADALLEKPHHIDLNEKEQKLIDTIFALQENVMGHQVLMKEIFEAQNDGQTNLNTDLTTDLSGGINE
jgi:hypothetical protein